jgi:Ca-activated chloride channel homolog
MTTRRTRLAVAGTLLGLTALAGAATRGGRPLGPVPRTATYTAPAGGPVAFTARLDRTSVLRGGDGLVRMELVIAGRSAGEEERTVRRPTDLVVVLDRSGSMQGEKIEHARAAVRELVGRLGSDDRFALVTYSNTATVTIPLGGADDGARAAWTACLATIVADGGTNMSGGLDLGLDVLEGARAPGRTARAILISDGLANQGDPTPEGLVRRASRAAHGEYVLSTVGVGSDFNEYLMTALADAGAGNYYYLRGSDDLGTVFAREFDAARETVASGLAVEIEPGRGVRVVDAAGYPLETADHRVVFRPGALFAGQERRIWVTLAVPQDALGEHDLGRFALSWGEGAARTTLALGDVPRVGCVARDDEFFAAVDGPTWARAVVVDAYNEMQANVAREVKSGRRDAALQRLRQFKDETAAINARLHAPEVDGQLGAADRLEREVAAAFEGADQNAKQNELSKAKSAAAVDARRVGAKK